MAPMSSAVPARFSRDNQSAVSRKHLAPREETAVLHRRGRRRHPSITVGYQTPLYNLHIRERQRSAPLAFANSFHFLHTLCISCLPSSKSVEEAKGIANNARTPNGATYRLPMNLAHRTPRKSETRRCERSQHHCRSFPPRVRPMW